MLRKYKHWSVQWTLPASDTTKASPLQLDEPSLTRMCNTMLLITAVRPKLESTKAYRPSLTPMIKSWQTALVACFLTTEMTGALKRDVPLSPSWENYIFTQKCSWLLTQTLIYLQYMYFENWNGLQTMKQLSLDLLRNVCVPAQVWARCEVCVCLFERMHHCPHVFVHYHTVTQ